jgi:hypothetical protein
MIARSSKGDSAMSELSHILNTLGLFCNIAGVILVWIYGGPQPSHEEGASLGLQNSTRLPSGLTVGERNASIRDRSAKYKRRSAVGFALMAVGFIFQLFATWI